MGERLVIGVGNPDRGDDGLGRVVAARLRDQVPADVSVLEHNGEMTALLEWLEDADGVYIVDAAASGAEPGTIHRFDAHGAPLPKAVLALSTHGFGVAEAIEMARAIGTLPTPCVVFAVEGASFDAGEPLSQAAERAVPDVSGRILAELAGQ